MRDSMSDTTPPGSLERAVLVGGPADLRTIGGIEINCRTLTLADKPIDGTIGLGSQGAQYSRPPYVLHHYHRFVLPEGGLAFYHQCERTCGYEQVDPTRLSTRALRKLTRRLIRGR